MQGDNVPAPITEFDSGVIPLDILKEVCISLVMNYHPRSNTNPKEFDKGQHVGSRGCALLYLYLFD